MGQTGYGLIDDKQTVYPAIVMPVTKRRGKFPAPWIGDYWVCPGTVLSFPFRMVSPFEVTG
jgi:hypothetical protein